MTRIPIEEEYGWRYWIWETPDTFEGAVKRFEDIVSDENFFCMSPVGLDLGGEWNKVEYEEWKQAVDDSGVSGHLHMSDDSWIVKMKEEEIT